MRSDAFNCMWAKGPNPGGLTELEVAAGVVLGTEPASAQVALKAQGALAALEDEARRLLERPPCVVAFSGGRDSSAVLAVFTRVARREGLPEPIVLTARWDDVPASQETEWQEHVVSALDIANWEIIRPGEDLDLLGPLATETLACDGLLWPAPSYCFIPMARNASGGVLVTGEGGDELFGLWSFAQTWWRIRHLKRPDLRALAALALAFGPVGLRRQIWLRKVSTYQDWLTPEASYAHARALADEMATEPPRWDRQLELTLSQRTLRLGLSTFARLCAGEGARFAAPLLAPGFVAALAKGGERTGFGGRSSVMTHVFGGILPEAILTRSTKATFGEVFWGPASRAFAREWEGQGTNKALVDPIKIRRAWLAPLPVYGAALGLHAAWLARSSQQTDSVPLGGSSP